MTPRLPGRSSPTGDPRERMQRVRVGMTGLAAVGLIVVVATAVATGVRRDTADTAAGRPAVVATVPATAPTEKSEPLAALGVAPDAQPEPKEQPASAVKRAN